MNETLEQYVWLVYFLKHSLSEAYEIVLFDITREGYPVIAQSSDNEESIRDTRKLVCSAVKKKGAAGPRMILNHILPGSSKMVKTGVFFLYDGNRAVGALCVNLSCLPYLKLQSVLGSMLRIDTKEGIPYAPDMETVQAETAPGPKSGSLEVVDEMVADYGVAPGRFKPYEKEELITDLYDTGVFNIKGAVPKTAEAMGISEQSVYRFIAKIKSMRS